MNEWKNFLPGERIYKYAMDKYHPTELITESMVLAFKPTYLMIKTHRITGLKYFCKTTRTDPEKYLGSGTYWGRHLRKHGKQHVETTWKYLFSDIYNLVEFALFFCEIADIVSARNNVGKKIWANEVIETGLAGGGNRGVAPAWSTTGNYLGFIDTSDNRWKTGEIHGTNKGTRTGKSPAWLVETGDYLGLVGSSDARWKEKTIRGYVNPNKPVSLKKQKPKKIRKPRVKKEKPAVVPKLKTKREFNETPAWDAITGEYIGKVRSDDLRWKLKEICGPTKNKAPGYLASTGEYLGLISTSDLRWGTGEIHGPGKNKIGTRGMCPAKEVKTGKRLGSIPLDDQRWEKGEICHAKKILRDDLQQ